MRPSEGKNITALCHEMQMCFQGDVFWYDSEELAKYILKDLLPKIEIVRRLSKFLPCLKSIYLSSPNTVVFPKLPPNYQTAPETIEKAYQILTSRRVLLLTGFSGIGKSALAVKLASLRKRSLIQCTTGVIKIHDVIYQCMRELSMEGVTEREYERCQQRFYQFFKRERDTKSADYFKALHLHEEKIAALARECQEPGEEWYFYLHSLSSNSAELLPASMEERLTAWPDGTPNKYVVGAILEYIDYRLRRMGYKDPARKSYIRASIEMLCNALPRLESSKDIYQNVAHHIGKLLVMAGDQDNAMCCFQHILESAPGRHETRLQIARIYKRTNRADLALPEYRRLLDTYLNGDSISMINSY